MIDQHASLSEKFLKKGFWLYLFSFIIAPIWYIIKIILSGELNVSEIWIIYWIISLITIISSFNDFWLTESLKHFIPIYSWEKKYSKVKSLLTYSFLIQIITSIIVAAIFYLWADFIALNYFNSLHASNSLKVFSLFFIWINIFQLFTTFLLSVQDTFYTKLTDLVRLSFSLLFIWIITFLDIWNIVIYSWWWIIWLYIWILFWLFIFFIKYYKKYLQKERILWNKKLFLKTFKYAIFVFIWAQAWTILSQIDMQMIIYLLWTVDAWYYTVYLSLIWIPFLIVTPLFQFLLPVFSELYWKKESKKILKIKNILSNSFWTIAIFIVSFLFVFSEILAYTLFWESYIKSWVILHYSIFFLIFNFLLQINFNVLGWIWKVKERVKIISIAIIFNFILNYILIQSPMLVNWAALATWLGWLIIYLMSEKILTKKYKVNLNYKFLTKNMIFMWLLWFFSYNFIIQFFENISRLHSFLYLILIAIIWVIIFWFINKKYLNSFILEFKKVKNNE